MELVSVIELLLQMKLHSNNTKVKKWGENQTESQEDKTDFLFCLSFSSDVKGRSQKLPLSYFNFLL